MIPEYVIKSCGADPSPSMQVPKKWASEVSQGYRESQRPRKILHSGVLAPKTARIPQTMVCRTLC